MGTHKESDITMNDSTITKYDAMLIYYVIMYTVNTKLFQGDVPNNWRDQKSLSEMTLEESFNLKANQKHVEEKWESMNNTGIVGRLLSCLK